jgi:hypothetical protein
MKEVGFFKGKALKKLEKTKDTKNPLKTKELVMRLNRMF